MKEAFYVDVQRPLTNFPEVITPLLQGTGTRFTENINRQFLRRFSVDNRCKNDVWLVDLV